MNATSIFIAAAVSALTLPACYITWDVAPGALRALDGFREGQTREIRSMDEEDVPFTSSTELFLRLNDGREARAKYRLIDVRGAQFVGVRADNGQGVGVDLTRLTTVEVTNFSIGRTIAWTVPFGLGVPLLAFVTILAYGYPG
jgi:hypothetical protein